MFRLCTLSHLRVRGSLAFQVHSTRSNTQNVMALIKDLREKTNAGILDCKAALEHSKGDINEAIEWLRKKGVSRASKLSSRAANEGGIVVNETDIQVTMLEINSETDFVSRNAKFHVFASQICELAHSCSVEKMDSATNSPVLAISELTTKTLPDPINPASIVPISDALKSLSANFGENLLLSRGVKLSVESKEKGVVASYVHNAIGPNVGTIGCAIALSCDSLNNEQRTKLKSIASSIALHIAGCPPRFLSIQNCSAEDIEKEKQVYIENAKQSGKPDNVIAKMVDGKMGKFYEEVVLNEQFSVTEEKPTKISQILKREEKNLGITNLKITSFARFRCGENNK